MADRPTPHPRLGQCPVCGKTAAPEYRPFCSARCRTVDLGRWLGEAYAIPATKQDDDAE